CGIFAWSAGEWLWRKTQRVYAQALTAAGAVFLYLSGWAAFGLYHLVPGVPTFVLMALVTTGAGGLALRYDSRVVALFGLAGGFATPLLLGSADPWFAVGYAILLDAGAVWASRLRNWTALEMTALMGNAALYLSRLDAAPWPQTVFVIATFALFTASRA